MTDKIAIIQVIGSLMKNPQFLHEPDKYQLDLSDFGTRFERSIFVAIDSLQRNGATCIRPIDVENFLSTNQTAKVTFDDNNGIEFLQDADYLAEVDNFPYYYNRLKKINLLNSLNKIGIDTSQFYIEDLTNPKATDINKNFEDLTISEIISTVKQQILKVEKNYSNGDTTETESAFKDIEDIIDDAENYNDVGFPIQGQIFNEVVAGARRGCLYIRSGSSGLSKTRQAVGDACYLAFPFRYDEKTEKWVQEGSNEKVLFIATEQNFKEIRKMILAYLTGFNETKFRYGNFSDRERLILQQAMVVLETFQDNFFIVKMPNPTIETLKTIIRENCLTKDIGYVFYDYIFIGPSILNEFKGFSLRNDEILLMLATALKDLAVELDIFVMTSTQVNANADDNKNIRNESSLAGSRAIINKADVGAIMARPTKEELDVLQELSLKTGITPNIVTDIYKVRSGEWNQVRIWTNFNFGNLRKEDLFITNSRLEVVDNFNAKYFYESGYTIEQEQELKEALNKINEMELEK